MTQPPIVSTTEALEALINKHDLQHILTGLELVCAEKAEHIKHNWQDRSTARPWQTASNRLGKLARETDI